jgi:hypothetical protein
MDEFDIESETMGLLVVGSIARFHPAQGDAIRFFDAHDLFILFDFPFKIWKDEFFNLFIEFISIRKDDEMAIDLEETVFQFHEISE